MVSWATGSLGHTHAGDDISNKIHHWVTGHTTRDFPEYDFEKITPSVFLKGLFSDHPYQICWMAMKAAASWANSYIFIHVKYFITPFKINFIGV